MNKVLLDTNILVYAIDEESKYFNPVQELLCDESIIFYTTSKNLSEFLSVVTRNQHCGLSIHEALSLIEDFKNSFSILYPTEKSYELFINLLTKYSPQGLKIHDFEIISIALANEIKCIATINKKDFIDIDEIELFNFK